MVAVMATNGNGPQQEFTPVLTAMSTMRDGQREQKKAAHQFLENFQKSVGFEVEEFRYSHWISQAHDIAGGGMADYNRDPTIPS
jgi:hypothetical protein